MIENTWESSLLPGRSFVQRALSNGTFRGLRQNLWSPQSTRFVFWPRSWDWRRRMMSMRPRAYGVEMCFAARSCGGGSSKATVFWRNKRNAESMGHC
ncbi:hypothetical protein AVEN_250001-1 [Araneus ventricosus]|uniref:Uncharacterized protein n=1 Tax=Araneus ventricosus TaxID=182803 RepID=A0A4Y2SMU8_ARAVE|nr:hypothetical protein AVEN_250001-1 [Araneus ventricosus]